MKLTQEQLAELIAKVFSSLTAKREAAIAAGESPGEITNETIWAEVEALLGENLGENGANGDDDNKGQKGAENAAPELINQIIAALAQLGEKSSKGATEGKAGGPTNVPPLTQRKYASLFLANGANRANDPESDFKSRIAKMSSSERRKYAYGMFGRSVKCINASGGDIEKAAYIAEHKFSDAEMAHEFKALSVTVPDGGGYLVPEVYANEIIELLYPATVIYSLGARRLGMANGNLNIPKIKTGSRALFTGENRSIPKSAPKFGNLKLSAKKLTALIPMSNDLLRSTNFDNDVIVGQDITKQMALGVDWGALLGTGGEFQPLGILKNKSVLNIDVTKLGDANYASNAGVLTAAFPNYLVAAVLRNNVYADGLGFVFNTSVEQFFKSMRDEVGGFIFAKEMNENGTLVGYPYKTTNLLETTGGKTDIIFGNWNDLIIGEQGALEIETSREGSWTDDSGNMVSAFENDQTLIRAIDNVDVGLRHDESFAVATKVSVAI